MKKQLVVFAGLALVVVATATSASLPLAPLSTLGKLKAAPAAGPEGLEGVAIPQVNILAQPQSLKLNETIDGITCQTTEKVAYHIHVHLTVFVDGKQRQVPYGIGIGPPLGGVKNAAGPFVEQGSCFAWLHTHAGDGVIHIESPTQTTYTLGDFFDIWGQKLSRSQVGPAKGKVTVLYDGKVWTGDPRAIPLVSEAQIQLEVGTPLVAPQTIVFPSGLAASVTKK